MEQLRALARQDGGELLVLQAWAGEGGGTCRLSCPYSPSDKVEVFSETPSVGCRAFSKVRQESLRKYAIPGMRVTALVGTLS